MCGICGFVGLPDEPTLQAMCGALVHHGPDDSGVLLDGSVALGHRRLSIIDLAGGRQPLTNESGSVAVVFNGEIYNHRQLRTELQALGHQFRTASDTEVIVHAYETWGTASVERLEGMFAYVLYDRNQRRLFGARDRLGKKPLYYLHEPVGPAAARLEFAFASELKALWRHPLLRASRQLSIPALISYLTHDYVTGRQSIDSRIARLLPGEAFEYGLSGSACPGWRLWRYWDLPSPSTGQVTWSLDEAADELLRLLGEAVEKRLMSDVPLGLFLSGGMDSLTILALWRERHPRERIQTFSIGFDEPSMDESAIARRSAQLFGSVHHENRFCVADLLERLPAAAAMLDEPFADPSILPTSLLCEFARETITVALGGDGGDELLAGYGPFLAIEPARWYRRLVPRTVHERLVCPLVGCLRSSEEHLALDFKLRRFLRGVAAPAELQPAVWMGPFFGDELSKLLPECGEELAAARTQALCVEAQSRFAIGDDFSRMQDFFQRFYLPDDILTKVDRAGMMHSLEIRSPFLDQTVVEFTNSLPQHMKLRRGMTKVLLRRALLRRRFVEPALLTGKKKGFGLPLTRWIRQELQPLFRRVLIDDWPPVLGMFDRAERARLLDDHLTGSVNRYKELWALFMLVQWANAHWR